MGDALFNQPSIAFSTRDSSLSWPAASSSGQLASTKAAGSVGSPTALLAPRPSGVYTGSADPSATNAAMTGSTAATTHPRSHVLLCNKVYV